MLFYGFYGAIREAIRRKNLLPFGFVLNSRDLPPPPVFLDAFDKLLKNLILYGLKVSKVFGFGLYSHIFLGKRLL